MYNYSLFEAHGAWETVKAVTMVRYIVYVLVGAWVLYIEKKQTIKCKRNRKKLVKVLVQSLSHVWLFATLWTAACQASLSFTVSWSLPKLMSVESVIPSNPLILCCVLLLPSVFPSVRVFPLSPLFTSRDQLPKLNSIYFVKLHSGLYSSKIPIFTVSI